MVSWLLIKVSYITNTWKICFRTFIQHQLRSLLDTKPQEGYNALGKVKPYIYQNQRIGDRFQSCALNIFLYKRYPTIN